VPFPPGGLTDVMARTIAQQLGQRWGANFVIDNKAGAGGQIGAAEVAKAPADGNTLLAITMSHAVNQSLFPNAPYSLLRDLRPVALLAGSPMLIVVPADSPIKDLRALVAEGKSGKLSGGSSGNGTPPHLTLELFNQLAGGKVAHVPYRGGAPSMTDLIGGQIQVVFSNFPESIAHVKGGKLRALAITSEQRNSLVPDVPTTTEAGMPELRIESWTALMAPVKTPDAIVSKLSAEVIKILATPEVDTWARNQGFRIDPRGPEAAAKFIASEVERWGKLVKSANITAS
jgi:tripartite-type tricarboxylate transporter receptor subunit TctC